MASNNMNKSSIYSADFVAGSLLISESRQIARLLLDGVDQKAWRKAIEVENVLQKRNPLAAKRQAKLIKNRLDLMKPELWELVVNGTSEVIVHALLAATIKQTRLLGDFMDKVIRQHWRTFTTRISSKDWEDFMETCAQMEPHVLKWTESTQNKIRQVAFRILAESKYIDGTRTLGLLPVSVTPDVRRYLVKNSEEYVLNCMEVTQ